MENQFEVSFAQLARESTELEMGVASMKSRRQQQQQW
jgi:hypothetical protein